VQRYLTGKSIGHNRLALLFNGMVKIPMQFSILLLGALIFVFYQFQTPPIFFNSVATTQVKESSYAENFRQLEARHEAISLEKAAAIRQLAFSLDRGDEKGSAENQAKIEELRTRAGEVRQQAVEIMQKNNPLMDSSDTNYIFLNFVLHYLPAGIVGLILAVIFSASMSSTASELNALASTTIVDIYKRMLNKQAGERHYLKISKIITVFWGLYAIIMAEFASRLGSLIEAVNIVGSLFYGTILGIFLAGFYFKALKGTAVFVGAILAEIIVIYCFFFTEITFLWYNVIGCIAVILFAYLITPLFPLWQKRSPA
jgi:SSS family solute:Na+ symporter